MELRLLTPTEMKAHPAFLRLAELRPQIAALVLGGSTTFTSDNDRECLAIDASEAAQRGAKFVKSYHERQAAGGAPPYVTRQASAAPAPPPRPAPPAEPPPPPPAAARRDAAEQEQERGYSELLSELGAHLPAPQRHEERRAEPDEDGRASLDLLAELERSATPTHADEADAGDASAELLALIGD